MSPSTILAARLNDRLQWAQKSKPIPRRIQRKTVHLIGPQMTASCQYREMQGYVSFPITKCRRCYIQQHVVCASFQIPYRMVLSSRNPSEFARILRAHVDSGHGLLVDSVQAWRINCLRGCLYCCSWGERRVWSKRKGDGLEHRLKHTCGA